MTNNFSFIRWFGIGQWAIYSVAPTPLCKYRRVMDHLHDLCGREAWYEKDVIDEALADEITPLTRHCTTVKRHWRDATEPPGVNWTCSDASNIAIAAVHIKTLAAVRLMKALPPKVPIVLFEMLSGLMAYLHLPHGTVWTCDNFAGARALVRGHSGSSCCDEILRYWLENAPTPDFVMWVNTHCMLSDCLTRPNEKMVQTPCQGKHQLWRVRWKP
jgi:hypothetical protein